MAHLLFLVHGMGRHHTPGTPNVWHEPIVEALDTAAVQYEKWTKNGRLRKSVAERREIIPITYDDLFEDQRSDWAQNASGVIDFIVGNPSRAAGGQLGDAEAGKILSFQQAFGEDTFFNTHLLDVLLYRFTFRGDQVRARVARKILSELKKGRSNGQHTYSIMAHSLGTSVVHDTLHALRTQSTNEAPGFPRTTALKQAIHLFMIANVSRVLQNQQRTPPAYRSVVKPAGGGRGACKYMYTATHDIDPIARTKEFDPTLDEWLGTDITKRRSINGVRVDFPRYHPIRIRRVTDPNVHAWTHYLQNPHVHRHILNSMTTSQIETSSADFKAAVRAHRSNPLVEAGEDVLDEIEQLSIRDPSSFQDVYLTWLKFGQLGQDLLDRVEGAQ